MEFLTLKKILRKKSNQLYNAKSPKQNKTPKKQWQSGTECSD